MSKAHPLAGSSRRSCTFSGALALIHSGPSWRSTGANAAVVMGGGIVIQMRRGEGQGSGSGSFAHGGVRAGALVGAAIASSGLVVLRRRSERQAEGGGRPVREA